MTRRTNKARGNARTVLSANRIVAVVALGGAIDKIRALAASIARMTDDLNELADYLGHMIVDRDGNLVGVDAKRSLRAVQGARRWTP